MGLSEKGGPCITPHSSASRMHQAGFMVQGKREQLAPASCPSPRGILLLVLEALGPQRLPICARG